MKHKIRETSLEAYQALGDLAERQKLVLDTIRRFPGMTATELTKLLQKSDPNFVRPRITELLSLGLVVEGDRRKCLLTNRSAITWYALV